MNGRVRPRLAKVGALAMGIAILVSSCARHAPQTTLKPKGPMAKQINDLINPVFMIAAVVFVLVLGGALFIAIKFRSKGDDDFDDFPKQVHGNFRAEITWTIIPAIILAVVGALTVATVLDLAKKPPANAVQVEVVGQQWWWEYRYDTNGDGKYDNIVTANDLVIPAGRVISLKITSRDVIHSWWAPALNGKKDAVPGRIHPLTIEAYKPGEYIGQCTEFCGLSHAEMRIKVVALSEADFAAWEQHQEHPFQNPPNTDKLAQLGWSIFAGQCTTCHRITGLTDPSKSPNDLSAATVLFQYPFSEAGKLNPQSGAKNQVSGAAPNLTHLMSRTMFAGGHYNLRKTTKACIALGEDWASTPNGIRDCLNVNDLKAWLRNAPAQKFMKPGPVMSPNSRGMPNLNLSEDQINQLVAFLTTLK